MELTILDNIFDKSLPAVSFSAGGCRAYCSTLGILRGINEIINRVPYISGVSGSSWAIMILSHLEDINIMFDINSEFKDFDNNLLVDLVVNMEPTYDLFSLLFKNSTDVGNQIANNNILKQFNLNDKSLKRKDGWPTYIIGSCHWKNDKFLPIDITPEYTLIDNKAIMHDEKITITNVVTCSSYIISILPEFLSYEMNIKDNKVKVNDGAYIDILGIHSLLRRRCDRIFATGIILLNTDGTLKFDCNITPEGINYNKIFEEWESIKEYLNNRLRERKICYYRTVVNVKDNIEYGIEAYQCEILFYFVTKVDEFMQKIPVEIAISSELMQFPNYSLFLTNYHSTVSLTKLQSYMIIALTEWCTKKIIEENIDFFN